MESHFLGKKLINCTHVIEPSTVTFANLFNLMPDSEGKTDGYVEVRACDTRNHNAESSIRPDATGFRKCVFSMPCDVGTHIDAPAHWFKDGRAIHELTLEELSSKGAVIDVQDKVA